MRSISRRSLLALAVLLVGADPAGDDASPKSDSGREAAESPDNTKGAEGNSAEENSADQKGADERKSAESAGGDERSTPESPETDEADDTDGDEGSDETSGDESVPLRDRDGGRIDELSKSKKEGWESCNRVRAERYSSPDDGPAAIVTYAYDETGQRIREEVDIDGDESAERVRTYRRNEAGKVTRRTVDGWGSANSYRGVSHPVEEADGDPDRIELTEYDDHGRLLRRELRTGDERETSKIEWREYDSAGNQTREAVDEDGDGDADREIRTEYGDHGNPVRRVRDKTGDGRPNEVEVFLYNARDNPVRLEVYESKYEYGPQGDPKLVARKGKLQKITTWIYDDEGRVLREQTTRRGDTDTLITHDYNADGNRVRRTTDERLDEEPEKVETWKYDDAGKKVQSRTEWYEDGESEKVEIEQFGDHGKVVRHVRDDRDGDPAPDRIVEYEYDDQGRLLRRKKGSGQGELRTAERRRYDDRGHLTRKAVGDRGDGPPTYVWIYEYECPPESPPAEQSQ